MKQDENKKQITQNTRNLLNDINSSSNDIFRKSMTFVLPSKYRLTFLVVFGIVIFILVYFFFFETNNAIKSYGELVKEVNEIAIPSFAVIITGYAIFQALANGETLITLISINNKEKSRFTEYNLFFLGISLLYLILMIYNLLMLYLFKNIPEDWHLTFLSNEVNEAIASFLIAVYLTFVMHCLIELKSFIYNLYQCFNINAAHTALKYLKESKGSDNQN